MRRDLTAFFTQKVAFKAGVSVLRPGALLTIRNDNVNYPILFLHLKSKDDPRNEWIEQYSDHCYLYLEVHS